MAIKVYDAQGNPQTLAWAESRYGFSLYPATPPPGSTVYRVTALRQRVGPAAQLVKVLDEAGDPLGRIVVLQGWEDGNPLPSDAAPRLSLSHWGQVHGKPNAGGGGFTNANGDFGWGWGPGEMYNPAAGQYGPHWYWVMPGDFQWFSDVALNFGWLIGTAHDTLNIDFTRMIEPDPDPDPDPDPEPEPPAEGDAIIDVDLRLTGQITIHKAPAF